MLFLLNPKKRAYLKGRWAEYFAWAYLKLKGYQILESRYKTPLGEIDLIARRGKALVAIEVKNRSSLEDAALAVTEHQWRRIERAFLHYLSSHAFSLDLRFDVILISSWRWPHHIKGAWCPA